MFRAYKNMGGEKCSPCFLSLRNFSDKIGIFLIYNISILGV
ncbi:Uncharacterized protein dnm_085710 [Desulfonema magnum]|uniref:Uncharacterized protein n=1 Tax=Desulfonema magnum TaxID=45655 RepID=A0A975BVG2_9BACT|nr:Uncharacterized protein dnm_085710 [Desulfonema magnum]